MYVRNYICLKTQKEKTETCQKIRTGLDLLKTADMYSNPNL